MLYARSFHDFEKNYRTWIFRWIKTISSWLRTTHFANHLIVLLIVIIVISPGIGLSNYSTNAFEDSEFEETSAEEEMILLEDELAYQINNEAVVKPYIPYTQQAEGINPFLEVYTCQEGDTLDSIAKSHAVTVKSIKLANNLKNNTVRSGQKLTIPPAEGIFYTIEEGDTVASLAKRFDAEEQQIIQANEIIDPEQLGPGKQIILPGVEPTPVPTVQTASNTSKKTTSSKKTSTSSSTVPSKSGSFGWPVNRSSCIRTQGWHGGHPGVDLASKGGRAIPIYASAAGTVVLAGWSGGYGKAVKIRHASGYHTLYGHFSKISVSSGQKVKRGQVIGYMGTTGYSTGVHLHFEICTNSCTGYSTSNRINPKRYGIY